MEQDESARFPDSMNAFMTTEHFTLQSARGMINSEIMNRVSLYFTTLSSVLIASAFLAQIPAMADLFGFFLWIAFPVLVLLGFFTLARLMVLSRIDAAYIRAINRVRQFYVQATPQIQAFFLFPPYDDDHSVNVYGGYTRDMRGNLLSAANAVSVTNSILATVLVSGLLSAALKMSAASFLPFGVVIFVGMYVLHGVLGTWLSARGLAKEYGEARFPVGEKFGKG